MKASNSHGRSQLWRSRWAAIGAAVAVTLGGGGLFIANAASSPASSVITIDPVRILDTRTDLGLPGPFVSPVSQKLQVTGSVVPAGATGVLLNATVVNPTGDGFLSIRPGDATGSPSTSSLNFKAGELIPNSVQVGLPANGQINITYDAYGVAGPTTEVLLDVVGYMVAGAGGPGPAGPKGDTGAQGPVGPAGPAAPILGDGRGVFLQEVGVTFDALNCGSGAFRIVVSERDRGLGPVFPTGPGTCYPFTRYSPGGSGINYRFLARMPLVVGAPRFEDMYRTEAPIPLAEQPGFLDNRWESGLGWSSQLLCRNIPGFNEFECEGYISFDSDPGNLTNGQLQDYFSRIEERIALYHYL